MSIADFKDWAELISKLAVPVLLFVFGLALVRKVEDLKAKASRASDFTKRWADAFVETSLAFVDSSERFIALLQQFTSNPPQPIKDRFLDEIWNLTLVMGEQALRIERLARAATRTGAMATKTATALQSALQELLRQRFANVDAIKQLQAAFTESARATHAEMLELQ